MNKVLNGKIRLNKGLISIVLVLSMFIQVLVPTTTAISAVGSFQAGSLIIPMDTTYQNMGMWKAYGLVYELLRKGIPVSWAINPDKAFNQADFSATTQDLRTGSSIGNHDYSGGPFIIDSQHADEALPIIQAWWAKSLNYPNVHKATSSFDANVDIVLKSPPRIANEEINSGIAISYYNAAGIPDLNGNPWTSDSPNILSQEEIADGGLFWDGPCSQLRFDTFITPHNGGYSYSLTDPNDLGTRTYAQLDYFVHQGGGWTALCHSILSNENAIANLYNNSSPAVKELFKAPAGGGFLTKNGFTSIANTGGNWNVTEPGLPIAQAVATAPGVTQGLPGGSVQTWNRTSVSYHSQTELVASFSNSGNIYDWAINGVAHDGTTLGKITFLGGHSYATSLPYSSNYEAPYLRFFYNSLFFNGAAVAKLDLTTSQAQIPQGQTSSVKISLINRGSSTATDTSDVSITLPAGVEYVGMSTGPAPAVTGDSSTGTTLTWGSSLGDISANLTALEVDVSVTPSATGEMKIAHLSADYGDVFGEGFNAELCRAIDVVPAPSLSISKVPDLQELYPGQVVSWQIDYSNTGEAALLNGVVEDILPAGFSFKSSSPAPSSIVPLPDGTTKIRWSIGTLDAGGYGSISLSSYASGEIATHTNTAKLKGTDSTNYSYEKTDTAEVSVKAPPMILEKSVSPDGGVEITSPGKILTYKMRPSFYGDADKLLENVLVSDTIPAYTGYVSGSANAGGANSYTPVAKVDGIDGDNGLVANSITVSPSLVEAGSTATVSMTITNRSGATVTNIVPTLNEKLGGATISAPSPASVASLANGASATFTFSCTMTDIGERVFDGSASGTDYSFAEAQSNTVLVTSTSPSGGVVTWRLGSNTPEVPGENIVSGYTPGVYAFRGATTKEFSKYGTSIDSWSSKNQPGSTIGKGGSLTTDGAGTIYASGGNATKNFYKYDIATGTWTLLSSTGLGASFNEGGSTQYLKVGGAKYVFSLIGNGNAFYRYNIAGNNWTQMTNTPASIKKGGALTTDGTYLYALQGDRKTGFYRYNVGTNTWATMAVAPGAVGWGGSLTRVGNYIYAFQGNSKSSFWRYDIAGNSWTTIAPAPGAVSEGGSLTTDGTYIYALQGKTKAFWRYEIATDTWTVMPATNFLGSVGQGGALVYDAGVTPVGQFTYLHTDAGLVTSGDTVKVTLKVESSTPISGVTIPAGSLSVAGATGASATLESGPTLKSADNNISGPGDYVEYEMTYKATSGTSPGSLTFSATPQYSSGTLPVAKARSVLVSPELSFQVQLLDAASIPGDLEQIANISMISDTAALGFGVNSNMVVNTLLRPKLTIWKSNSPGEGGTVHPGDEITYTIVVGNEGSGTATNIEIADLIPPNTSYVPGSASADDSPDDPTRTVSITEPSGGEPLKCSVSKLKTDEFITLTFKVVASGDLEPGSYNIANQGTVTANGIAPLTSNTVNNTLVLQKSFGVNKISSIALATAIGQTIDYSIEVINTGNVEISSVSVSDPMLPDLAYSHGDNDGDGKLDPGEIWYYNGSYVLSESDIIKENGVPVVRNTATVTADGEAKEATTVVEIEISNLNIVMLPATGGSGTMLFSMGGIGIMTTSAAMYRRRSKRIKGR